MDLLNQYLTAYKAPSALRDSLREYVIFCRSLKREERFRSVLDQLSPDLRRRLMVHCYGPSIACVPFFTPNLEWYSGQERLDVVVETNVFAGLVASAMTPCAVPPLECVFHAGEPAAAMYIIKNGIVGVLGRIMGYDQFFGEDVVLREDYIRFYSATALSFVDLFVLERSALLAILDSPRFPHIQRLVKKVQVRLAMDLAARTAAVARRPPRESTAQTAILARIGAASPSVFLSRSTLPPPEPATDPVVPVSPAQPPSIPVIPVSAAGVGAPGTGFTESDRQTLASLAAMVQRLSASVSRLEANARA